MYYKIMNPAGVTEKAFT